MNKKFYSFIIAKRSDIVGVSPLVDSVYVQYILNMNNIKTNWK